jgi:hypothetical protein
MPKRAKIGDVVEITTKNGYSYAHFTHKHPTHGALLKVFNRNYPQRPDRFIGVVEGEPDFMCFFPLAAAVSRGIVTIAANVELSEQARNFPVFRGGLEGDDRKVKSWWLWDGEREWCVGQLTDEQKGLSVRQVLNDAALVDRIEAGWTPKMDPR